MDHMITSRLDLPARKIMIQDLMKAKSTANTTAISDLCMWKIHTNQEFSLIWIQGTVIKVHSDGNSFMMDDGTSTAEIVDCSGVPPGCPRPVQNKYMMVVGELVRISPGPAMKAMKIQDLSSDGQAQGLWPMEVQDLNRFLANQRDK